MIEKIKKKHNPRKAAGHNSVPSKQTTLFCIRVAHGLLPWKIVWVMFFNWVLIRHHIFWETGHFWEFQMKETKKEINWKENTLASKGKGKGNDWKNQKKSWPRKAAGHNSVPSKQTTLFCIRVAHGLPSWKIVWVMFFNWVLIRHHIFWETGHFWEFQMKETKKEINWKENALASKGKGKGNDWTNQKNHDLRKQLDTIVYPQTNHTILYLDVIFCGSIWKISMLENKK